MARKCSICQHEQRATIDERLVDGTSVRDISGRFGTSKSALDRHKQHLKSELRQAAQREAKESTNRGDNLLGQVRNLHSEALDLLETAKKKGDLRVAISAISPLTSVLRLLADLEVKAPEATEPPELVLEGATVEEVRRLLQDTVGAWGVGPDSPTRVGRDLTPERALRSSIQRPEPLLSGKRIPPDG